MKRKRMLSWLTALALVLCVEAPALRAAEDTVDENALFTAQNTYSEYKARYTEAPMGTETLVGGGTDGQSFAVTVPEEGLYHLTIEYTAVAGEGADLEAGLRLDGAYPFAEAEYCTFYRVWADAVPAGQEKDSRDNDLIPSQAEKEIRQKAWVEDHTNLYREPYLFYLTKGEHQVTLEVQRGAMTIHSLIFTQKPELPSYEKLAEGYRQAGYKPVEKAFQKIEAEQTLYKSDSVIYGLNDRSSPLTTPYSPSKIRLNTVGGGAFSSGGQWIEWRIEAPESGLYKLAFRARQNLLSGAFVTRKIYIDGVVPCREMENIKINYDSDWQNVEIPYDIYLEKGEHTLRVEVNTGELAGVIEQADKAVRGLNLAYRKIVMITGPTPDRYRDFDLTNTAAEAFKIFEEQTKILKACNEELLRVVGKKGSLNGTLQTVWMQLDRFLAKPERVQRELATFKSNIGSLATWLINIKQQGLELDCLYLYGGKDTLPKADSGFLGQSLHEIRAFAASFFEDYTAVGGASGQGRSVEVWVQTGRDQANILKSLATSRFSPQSGIDVVLKLVPNQLLMAVASGKGPDVVLQNDPTVPVNYAIRGAAQELSGFAGFAETAGWFRPSAMEPFRFQEGVYALPETQVFQMMFYRTDIFEELGLNPPNTWDEAFAVVGRLQKKNMTMGIPPSSSVLGAPTALSSMAMMLYQKGGHMYSEDGRKSGLSSDEAVDAFKTWSSFYKDYLLPVQYDALNRFRTGEMPIVIEDFSFYNLVSVAAPEIKGMWDFQGVPGTLKTDGSVDRSVVSNGLCSMMLSGAKDKEAAWDFLKWWLSAETQTAFGRQIENQLGRSARYSTANTEAFDSIPWSQKEYGKITAEMQWVKGIPQVPGGYFTSRHLNNAFRKVITQNTDDKETLLEYAQVIDREIEDKYREFEIK